jgi:hypothetical protein
VRDIIGAEVDVGLSIRPRQQETGHTLQSNFMLCVHACTRIHTSNVRACISGHCALVVNNRYLIADSQVNLI